MTKQLEATFIELWTNIEGDVVARFKWAIGFFDGNGNFKTHFNLKEQHVKERLENLKRDGKPISEEMKALEAFEKRR